MNEILHDYGEDDDLDDDEDPECLVCGAFGAELLSSCPGYVLNKDALSACCIGKVCDLAFWKIANYRRFTK